MKAKYVFGTFSSELVMGTGMVYEATNRGYKKAAIFFGDDESAQSIRGVAVPSCKAAGIEIVRDITGSARELLERGGDEALGV